MKRIYLILISVLFFSCAGSFTKMYSKAVRNASHPSIERIDTNLTVISEANTLLERKPDDPRYIRVVSLRPDTTHLDPDNKGFFHPPSRYPVWVTVSPEIKDFFLGHRMSYPRDTLRIRQLMGFPPNKQLAWVVTFWVKMEDLFRPCPDGETNDKACQLYFPVDTKWDHFIFIESYRTNSYCHKTNPLLNYPWTQLGYTYDWNPQNKSHMGLSEFVIKPGAGVIIEAKVRIEDYLKAERPS